MYLIFDTETTGLWHFEKPAEHLDQPRIVQLACVLYSPGRKLLAELNVLVKREGFEIPEDATRVHGITNEAVDEYGLPEPFVLTMFNQLLSRSKFLIAHNMQYDLNIVNRALLLHKFPVIDNIAKICTMEEMTPVCQIKSLRRGFKWPKLSEAYEYCFDEPPEVSHDAMADVRACSDIFWWLKDNQSI